MKNFDQFFYLAEGGNLSIDNKYFADDINLSYLSNDKAVTFIEDLENLFRDINKIYTTEFGNPLWEQLETLLRTNKIYSGSSKIFVEFVKEGKYDLFAQYKTLLGDFDIQFNEDFSSNFEELFKLNSSKLCNSNAPTPIGKFIFYGEGGTGAIQKNCLFGYKFGVNMDTGEESPEKITYVQVDFEPVSFDRGIPTKFSQFSHSASFDDIQEGIKGVFHKFLLQTILDVSNEILVDIGLYKLKSQKKTTRRGTKKTLYSFSVDRGFRQRYVPMTNAPQNDSILINNIGEFSYFDITNNNERNEVKNNNYRVELNQKGQLINDLKGVDLPERDAVFINPSSLEYSQDLDVLFSLMFGEEPDN